MSLFEPTRRSRSHTVPDGRGRLRRRCTVGVGRLEDRTLLSGSPGDALAAATPIALGESTAGALAPADVAYYRIDPAGDGRLVARVQSGVMIARLSLLDGQGRVLLQSDGTSDSE